MTPQDDRRASAHRRVAGDRRTMICHAEVVEIAEQAMAIGEAIAAERIRMAAEYELTKGGPHGLS